MAFPEPAAETTLVGFDIDLVGFDIETDTSTGGLDPASSQIVAVALSSSDGDEVFLGSELDILTAVDRRIAEFDHGLLVTWNGAGFDLPFVAHRSALIGLDTGLATREDPTRRSPRDPDRPAVRGRWHNLVHLDGYQLYRADVGRTLGLSCGLKPLAKLAGMTPVELDRTELHLATSDSVARYVASDARLAAELVRRRMPTALSMADYEPPLR
ncbi:MAG: ribonuclease H-like domain-containing protein [Microthrixaceae bacterium]